MKRYIFAAMAILAMLCGCSAKDSLELLSAEDEQLSYSMKQFFAAEDMGYADSRQFSAKLLDCTKAKHMTDDYVLYSFYRYRLVIAPRANMPMDKISVKVFPTNDVTDYLEWVTDRGDRLTDPKQGFILEYPPMGITQKNELQAFEYNFYLSNFGDDAMKDFGMSEADFDKGMTELRIEVYCDGKTDVLDLYCLGDVQTVIKADDDIAAQDRMVKDLVETGKSDAITFGVFTP